MSKTTNGPVGIPTGDMKVGVVEPAKGSEDRPNEDDSYERVLQEGRGRITYSTTFSATCRWCQKQFEVPCLDRDWPVCPYCGSYQTATLSLSHNASKQSIRIWYNPDNSLFVEFSKPDGKTARYTLSQEKLLALGLLELFDEFPYGKKC